jgi:hypothetical protein
MFSGPWEKIAISVVIGFLLGLADAVGFFYTVKFFLANSAGVKKVVAGFFEISRLILIIIFIIFLSSHKIILFVPLFLLALIMSLGGKMLLILKGLKQ